MKNLKIVNISMEYDNNWEAIFATGFDIEWVSDGGFGELQVLVTDDGKVEINDELMGKDVFMELMSLLWDKYSPNNFEKDK